MAGIAVRGKKREKLPPRRADAYLKLFGSLGRQGMEPFVAVARALLKIDTHTLHLWSAVLSKRPGSQGLKIAKSLRTIQQLRTE